MLSILHFRRQFDDPPVAADALGIVVRHLKVPEDVPAWLALRERAMGGQIPAARPWTASDFRREMFGKVWWRSDRSWVAMTSDAGDEAPRVVGAVTLAVREGAAGVVPVVNWLLVDPAFRRRGVGRALMSRLEQAVWDAGWREVQLETHAGWSAAVAFYQSMGYAPVRERSPR